MERRENEVKNHDGTKAAAGLGMGVTTKKTLGEERGQDGDEGVRHEQEAELERRRVERVERAAAK